MRPPPAAGHMAAVFPALPAGGGRPGRRSPFAGTAATGTVVPAPEKRPGPFRRRPAHPCRPPVALLEVLEVAARGRAALALVLGAGGGGAVGVVRGRRHPQE